MPDKNLDEPFKIEIGLHYGPFPPEDGAIQEDLKKANFEAMFAAMNANFIHAIAKQYDDLGDARLFYAKLQSALVKVLQRLKHPREDEPNYRVVAVGDGSSHEVPSNAEFDRVSVCWRNLFRSFGRICLPIAAVSRELTLAANGIVNLDLDLNQA